MATSPLRRHGGRCGTPPAAAAVLLFLAAVLLGALPSSRACENPLTHSYRKVSSYNPADGRNYTLFDIHTASGCLNEWATAKEVCKREGLEMAPQGEEASLASFHELCSRRHFTCWMDGKPPGRGLCYLMSQEGHTLKQSCKQPVRFVCRDKESAANFVPAGVLHVTKDGYDYRMYTTDATRRTSYSGAVKFCQGLGQGWDLVPYWNDRSNGCSAVKELCARHSYTCWLKRKHTDRRLCPLMAADGSLQMQGCEQDVRFVCRRKKATSRG